MSDFDLICTTCSKEFSAEFIEPGMIPECSECGNPLRVPGVLTFRCEQCDAETEPMLLEDLREPIHCPSCQAPMVLASQRPLVVDKQNALQATISTETIIEETIHLASDKKSPVPSNDDHESERTGEKVEKPKLRLAKRGGQQVISLEKPGGIYQEAAETMITDTNKSTIGGLGSREKFGKYEIVREIARGGMGVVYQVKDPDLRRELALKVLLQQDGASEEVVKRFMREGRAAANLKHPNIINVHEMGQIDGQYYFTMDMVDGQSFQEIIRLRHTKHGMEPIEFITHMRDVCHALEFAHAQGIYHRDLKPANIMLESGTNRVIVMDFGLAKDCSSMSIQSMTGSVFGSPAYMSPEQAKGQVHDIDHRSDIYSMGVILYEGLTAAQPFKGENAYETMTQVISKDPVPPRDIAPTDVPKILQNIILKCMEKSKYNRYASMKELAKDLTAYMQGGRVSARSIAVTTRAWRRLRRHPVFLASLVIVPLLLIAGVLAWLVLAGPPYVLIAEKALKSDDVDRRIGALKELAAHLRSGRIHSNSQKERALTLLRKYINVPNLTLSETAINACVEANDSKALPVLAQIAIASDGAENVRSRAAAAFSQIAETHPQAALEYAPALGDIICDSKLPTRLRIKCVKGVKCAMGPKATSFLIDIACDERQPSELRVSALKALGDIIAIGGNYMKRLLPLCGDDDEEVAKAADHLLKKCRTKNAVLNIYGLGDAVANAYIKVAEVQKLNADRNRNIAKYLDDQGDWDAKKPKKKDDSESAASQTPLQAMTAKLNSPKISERLAAAYDLGELGDPEAVPVLEKHLSSDEDNGVRKIVVRSLVKLAERRPPDSSTVKKMLRSKDILVREQGVFLLAATRGQSAVPDLTRGADEESSKRVIAMYAHVFGKLKNPKTLPALFKLLEKSENKSKSSAFACIDALASFEKPAIPWLIKALGEDHRAPIREAAAKELMELSGEDFGTNQEKWQNWFARQ